MQVIIPCVHRRERREENTNAYLKVMENPYVNIIGHPEDGYIPVDFEDTGGAAQRKHHVLLEVNNSSLKGRITTG